MMRHTYKPPGNEDSCRNIALRFMAVFALVLVSFGTVIWGRK